MRQLCGRYFEVYDLKEGKVFEHPDERDVFSKLDPKKSRSDGTRSFSETWSTRSSSSNIYPVSPDSSRYKEFQKISITRTFYMPCYSLEELLTLGQDLVENRLVPSGLEEYYTQSSIEERHHKYGGTTCFTSL